MSSRHPKEGRSPAWKKNELLNLTVEAYGNNGEGIAKADAFPFFIKDAVAGDVIRARITRICAHYGYARIEELLSPSPDRVAPRCPVWARCGGCTLQALSYEAELRLKQAKVHDCLLRLAGIPEKLLAEAEEPIAGMDSPWRYRNKAQYPVGLSREGFLCAGFYAARTHEIVPHSDCLLSPPEFSPILRCVLDFLEEFQIPPYDEKTGSGQIRHIFLRKGFSSGELMVCLVSAKGTLPHCEELLHRLESFPEIVSVVLNINPARTNVILGKENRLLAGKEALTDTLLGLSFRIPPGAFYQVNPVMTRQLYETVLDYAALRGNEEVWDICCGIGTITLALAGRARFVHGLEIVPEAVADARENAKANRISNVAFIEADVTDYVRRFRDTMHADVVVLDPPRKGLSRPVLDAVVEMSPERIVYVSCDPATLSRDLKVFLAAGFRLRRFRAFDQFCRSAHVETCVLLSHQQVKKSVTIDYTPDGSYMKDVNKHATYKEINEYVEEKYGFKLHSAFIAQVKREMGIEMGENYNLSKSDDYQPREVTPEKRAAIIDALKHFNMIE